MEETYQYQDDWTDADRQQPFTYGGYGGYPYPRPRPRPRPRPPFYPYPFFYPFFPFYPYHPYYPYPW
ncbi:hypothetical protein [Bacillus paralicheniformis]|uniref:hypothetical protein n=1 Tax=Bacillus paralicheniformis TaxID=1648923 RepID=UPI001C5885F5|nr:hypothetical protein [Bacillus paralicheniformis]